MRTGILDQLFREGFVVLEDFLNETEVRELREAGVQLADEDVPVEERRLSVFSTTNMEQSASKHFMESGHKIQRFWERDALSPSGELLVDKVRALNKVGHALHLLHPVFKRYTFDERVKEVCWQLGLAEPAVAQSMYIYKNPGVGGEVIAHQDASYLHTEPQNLVGFWIALDDATTENGCLWVAPGSHRSDVHRRYVRNPDADAEQLLVYTAPEPIYQRNMFQPVPVPKGACVLIHGQVVHYSEANKSEKSRHAYTFHVIEQKNTAYCKQNWLQPTPENPFANIYKTK